MGQLDGKRVAMVVANQFEDSEAFDPKAYLEAGGATVTVIAMEPGTLQGKKGATLEPDTTFDQVAVNDFDALVIPGGGSPEYLRIFDPALEFTRAFVDSGKPVASICHGPQLLISANVLRGRTSIVISHRVSSVRRADQIVVVDDGRIVERGTHDELVRKDGLYADLYRRQQITEELEAM